jgi:hypothetical protein
VRHREQRSSTSFDLKRALRSVIAAPSTAYSSPSSAEDRCDALYRLHDYRPVGWPVRPTLRDDVLFRHSQHQGREICSRGNQAVFIRCGIRDISLHFDGGIHM